MDKLELRHLAPYLPYGLKCEQYGEAFGLRDCLGWGVEFKDKTGCVLVPLCAVKPILRPLSLLIKEIEINGEKFVPSSRLYRDFDLSPNYYGRLGMLFNGNGIDDPIHGYLVVNKLFEWHFDVFGLIDRGLAVDATKLEGGNL